MPASLIVPSRETHGEQPAVGARGTTGPVVISLFSEESLASRREFAEVLFKAALRLNFVVHVAHPLGVRSTGCLVGIFRQSGVGEKKRYTSQKRQLK